MSKKKKTSKKNVDGDPVLDGNSSYQIHYTTEIDGQAVAKLRRENTILKKMLSSYLLTELENEGHSMSEDEAQETI